MVVMALSDLEDSTVNYTEALPSPDYVPSIEHPHSPAYVPEFVPEPIYPEDDDDEDPKEDPVAYPINKENYDEEEEESSEYDDDDEEEEEDEDEEEEEHSAPVDSILLPQVFSKLHYHLGRGCALLSNPDLRSRDSSAHTARPTRGIRADYGFVRTLNDEIRQDNDEIYRRLDDAQDDRLLMSGQLNSLCRDRHSYARTARLIESEMEIAGLRAADRTRQTQLVEALTRLKTLQTQMTALQRQ
nr:hypothetical protein [Tanacetum cinerariifolium]